MKPTNLIASLVVFLLSLSAFAATEDATETRTKRLNARDEMADNGLSKNAFAAELLGRGFLYTLTYDRSITDQFSVGAGFSAWSGESPSIKTSVQVIPVFANYYFTPGSHRGFITGGVDIVNVKWSYRADVLSVSGETFGFQEDLNRTSASGAVPTLGAGYEFRGESGFLFRASLYEFIGQAKAITWFGLGFGFAI